jgi:hypothetical protein
MDTSILIIAAIVAYFIPTIIGWNKKHSSGILAVNLLLGWTFLGWVASLVWALSSPGKPDIWTYTCPRCFYKTELNQKVRIHICPQCRTESQYDF